MPPGCVRPDFYPGPHLWRWARDLRWQRPLRILPVSRASARHCPSKSSDDVAHRAAHGRAHRGDGAQHHPLVPLRSGRCQGSGRRRCPAFLQAASKLDQCLARRRAAAHRTTRPKRRCGGSPLGPRHTGDRGHPPRAAPNFASSVAKWAWPFSIGTMVVSGTDGRRDRRDEAGVEVVALAGQDHDVVGPAIVGPWSDLHWHGEISLRAFHHQAVGFHHRRTLLAQQESDVGSGLRQARTQSRRPRRRPGSGSSLLDFPFRPPSRRARSRGRRSDGEWSRSILRRA